MSEISKKIEDKINELKFFVQQDGGDMEFVAYKDRTVYLRLMGNCIGCGLVDVTFREGIEMIMLEEFPHDVDGIDIVM
ncbi:NifU-like domain-containing protein [Spiroplasma sabaudiense Ar-1343]|uniref:NifU-like domain-containing protein n=1 Tax=Spiroplasma sabaudiense Ar-1343 TaxID=1276257 RepID=W6AJX5_9MOLU|nr:NifU family protein [Spiroplasma sabaudiense]AHI54029.1 NifU-like domain-containing protein [Spiroplasma sabaudiense Ar-1343]